MTLQEKIEKFNYVKCLSGNGWDRKFTKGKVYSVLGGNHNGGIDLIDNKKECRGVYSDYFTKYNAEYENDFIFITDKKAEELGYKD